MVIQFGMIKQKKVKQEVLVDFVDPEILEKAIELKKQEVKTLSQQQFIKNLQQEYSIKNIAVNEADHDARPAVDQMVKDIKSELNINESKPREQLNPQAKIEEIKKKEPEVTDKRPKFNAQGEPLFYKGPTTISYTLEGRSHVYINPPVYQCQGSGKVVVDIVVNQSGYVIDANINKSKSQITEDCLVEAANRAALTTRFNAKNTAPDRQRGTITYIFIAQ
jgi:TonB family protein